MRTMAEIIRKHLGNGTASKPYDLQERVDRFNLKQGNLPGYNCPICRNKGVVMEVRGDKEHLTECGCIGIRFALAIVRTVTDD